MLYRVRKAVIPTAGLGTRFLPVTKAIPKEREHWLARRGAEDHLDLVGQVSRLADLHFIRQKTPLGLGDAVRLAHRHIGEEPFAVLLADVVIDGDTPCLRQIIDGQRATGETVVAVHPVAEDEVDRYGVVAPASPAGEGPIRVADLVEKPATGEAPSLLAITGRYILHPDVFAALAEVRPGRLGEIHLTDALRLTARRRADNAMGFEGVPYDLGTVTGFLAANLALARKRPDLRLGGQVELRADTPPPFSQEVSL